MEVRVEPSAAGQFMKFCGNSVVATSNGSPLYLGIKLNAVNPGSDRRTLSASIGYNIFKRPEHRFEIRFNQNDNRFETLGQDFKESVWQAALTDRFWT